MGLKRNILYSILILSCCFQSNDVFGTHNRAGEITYQQIGDLAIRMTLTTYTKTSSVRADRDSIEIFWGDGTSTYVLRDTAIELSNDVKKNVYIEDHIYPGQATYTIYMQDPNRIGNIKNVNPPNSINIRFYIETTFTFLNTQFQGFNSSPVLLQPPIDFACVGQPFIHNPNAYDRDGDSISYELITPLQAPDSLVPRYSFPDQILAGANNQISLSSTTGDFIWMSPQISGEFNIAIAIHEYRNGFKINTTIRDMQILVQNCENQPPTIEAPEEICVIAGEIIDFPVIADDPDDPIQKVLLTALGGPLILDTFQATFTAPTSYQDAPVEGRFTWQTRCEHISDQYYSIIFKAQDNYFDSTGLAALKSYRIKIVGPPPENLEANAENGEILLSWEKPYDCEEDYFDYFRGFSVWRKVGSNIFEMDTCRLGLDGRGYTKVKFTTTEMLDGKYIYRDADVEKGKTYCYRILAEFAQKSAAGNPFNIIESLPSEEVCLQVSRDIPLITNVDILNTNASMGSIYIEWSLPLAEDLDTLKNPGPYRYQLQRALGITDLNFIDIPGATFSHDHLTDPVDNFYFDNNTNTVGEAYTYRVAFFTSDRPDAFGNSAPASSIFLSIEPADNTNILTWDEMVPWQNFSYTIFKQNTSGGFDSIATSIESQYNDNGLTNGQAYCYLIRSTGTYNLVDVKDPLINHSQEVCSTPIDLTPPCALNLEVENVCDNADNSTPQDAFTNTLSWNNPIISCDKSRDVVFYNLYYGIAEGAPLNIIETITDPSLITFEHVPEMGIAGCYAVTAVDSAGNESDLSNIICVENCPFYELPNVFTPNGDGINDKYQPFAYRFIDRIDMKIFNRWGNLVFETNDPDINWNGSNLNGKELAEGAYYYACKVFESRTGAVVERPNTLSGFIELIRGE